MGGMAFYDIEYEGKPKFIKNLNYKNIHHIRKVCLKKLKSFGIDPNQPIYSSAISEPQKFRFILDPQDYLELFDNIVREDINERSGENA